MERRMVAKYPWCKGTRVKRRGSILAAFLKVELMDLLNLYLQGRVFTADFGKQYMQYLTR